MYSFRSPAGVHTPRVCTLISAVRPGRFSQAASSARKANGSTYFSQAASSARKVNASFYFSQPASSAGYVNGSFYFSQPASSARKVNGSFYFSQAASFARKGERKHLLFSGGGEYACMEFHVRIKAFVRISIRIKSFGGPMAFSGCGSKLELFHWKPALTHTRCGFSIPLILHLSPPVILSCFHFTRKQSVLVTSN